MTTDGIPEKIHYIPNELCVVVTMQTTSAPTDTYPKYEGVYTGVQDWLSGFISAHDPRRVPANNAFARDLSVSHVFAGCDQILKPLKRDHIDYEQSKGFKPWVFLPEGRNLTALHFYCVNVPATGETVDVVAQLVSLVNGHVAGQVIDRPPEGFEHVQIVAATPHWLSAAAQNYHTGAGPGTAPRPPDPKSSPPQGNFVFADANLNAVIKNGRESESRETSSRVVVAVLDTRPDAATVQQALQRCRENSASDAAPWKALLEDVWNKVETELQVSQPSDMFPYENEYVANWHASLSELTAGGAGHDSFFMADHGLFVSGIIHSIAPGADLQLVRVLSDYGVGDLLTLATVLARLPQLLLNDDPDRRLIINLSLMVDVPPSEEHLGMWFPETSEKVDVLRQRLVDVYKTLEMTYHSLTVVIEWLNRRPDVLVVAAAGNGNLEATRDHQARPEPGLPARYREVLGVAAVDRERQPSNFSNRGDIWYFGNGVAVLGGKAVDGAPPTIEQSDGQPDALAGIFTAERLPFGPENSQCWVYWAGTSFATPIISGIAAALWESDPSLLPDKLMTKIQAFADQPENALDCRAIVATQQ